jgi:hypothetical protein
MIDPITLGVVSQALPLAGGLLGIESPQQQALNLQIQLQRENYLAQKSLTEQQARINQNAPKSFFRSPEFIAIVIGVLLIVTVLVIKLV